MSFLKSHLDKIYLLILVVMSGIFLGFRSSKILEGNLTFVDSVIFIVFIALILSPLFKELKLFGFSFKSELSDLKNDIKGEILNLRTEINNNVTVNPSFKVEFSPDAKNEIDKISKESESKTQFNIPDEVVELFKMRYALEVKLMDIAEDLYPETMGRDFTSMTEVLLKLQRDKMIDNTIAKLAREFLMISNSAIHGIIPNEFDLKLARRLAPALLSKLDSLE